jgi:hypothetical protein
LCPCCCFFLFAFHRVDFDLDPVAIDRRLRYLGVRESSDPSPAKYHPATRTRPSLLIVCHFDLRANIHFEPCAEHQPVNIRSISLDPTHRKAQPDITIARSSPSGLFAVSRFHYLHRSSLCYPDSELPPSWQTHRFHHRPSFLANHRSQSLHLLPVGALQRSSFQPKITAGHANSSPRSSSLRITPALKNHDLDLDRLVHRYPWHDTLTIELLVRILPTSSV